MRWRSFAVLGLSLTHLGCTLLTDFSGVADGDGSTAGSGGASGAAGAGGSKELGFPRLGIFETSNPKSFDEPSYQEKAARFHVLVMGVYPGWVGPGAIEDAASAIKAQSTKAHTKVFVHASADHFHADPAESAYQPVIDKLNAESWWLYESGTSGTQVVYPGINDQFVTNTTLLTSKDSDGYTFIEWFARYLKQTYLDENPSLDGIQTGYMGYKARVSGDYDRDGTLDDVADPQTSTWYREGYAKYFADLNQIAPGKIQLADLTEFGNDAAVYPELEGVMPGGVAEGMLGKDWSPEAWGGFEQMMADYRRVMKAVVAPKLVIFASYGAPDDYQTFRYAFASCLMDDAYFMWDDENFGVEWYDEYEVDLGQATTPPPTAAWKNGVYRRDFENGIALVNPKGNGTIALPLETSYRRIVGTQDPSVNNGTTSNNVLLADRDGIILLKK